MIPPYRRAQQTLGLLSPTSPGILAQLLKFWSRESWENFKRWRNSVMYCRCIFLMNGIGERFLMRTEGIDLPVSAGKAG